jgi:DNA-binding NtrC family response regulator
LKVVHVPASRIFVGDEEHVIVSTLAAAVNMNGFSARSFIGPPEALAAARADIPDLLISDVAMPALSGIELAIRMKPQHPECKISLFSGQTHTADLLEGARHRGHHFRLRVKPVFPDELLSEINKSDGDPNCQPEAGSTPGLHLVR